MASIPFGGRYRLIDFALSNKPCFQFATDIEDYKKDRNFYFDLYSLPFELAKNNDEMVDIISNFDQQAYQKKLDEFFKKVGMVRDGKASERCANWILKIIKKPGEINEKSYNVWNV